MVPGVLTNSLNPLLGTTKSFVALSPFSKSGGESDYTNNLSPFKIVNTNNLSPFKIVNKTNEHYPSVTLAFEVLYTQELHTKLLTTRSSQLILHSH